jgi:hypothetical protein
VCKSASKRPVTGAGTGGSAAGSASPVAQVRRPHVKYQLLLSGYHVVQHDMDATSTCNIQCYTSKSHTRVSTPDSSHKDSSLPAVLRYLLMLCAHQYIFVRTLISKTSTVAPATAAHDNMQLSHCFTAAHLLQVPSLLQMASKSFDGTRSQLLSPVSYLQAAAHKSGISGCLIIVLHMHGCCMYTRHRRLARHRALRTATHRFW